MRTLHVNLGKDSYDITVGHGLLSDADKYFNLNRKALIVTDDGVPEQYARAVAQRAKEAKTVTVHMGEGAKSLGVLETLLCAMSDFGMGRGDCAVAVGGGVVGDLTGFAAACYMRGIDFYNVPTTLLSQVDSSVGGKTAVNLAGIKNIVGAFHQPSAVLVDTEVLKTLPKRQLSNGLAEAIKMSVTSDASLFEKFERLSENELYESIEDIIVASLKIKRDVVEKDEKESNLRKVLNFGHTFGHGVEAEGELRDMYHGECVAIGMLPMCDSDVRERLSAVLKKFSLPTEYCGDIDTALGFVTHDKKCSGGMIDAIYVPRIGEFTIRRMSAEEFSELVKSRIK